MPIMRFAVVLLHSVLLAQSTPEELARTVVNRFVSGTQQEFDAVYPFAEGRKLLSESLRGKYARTAGLSVVVSKTPDKAVLLLAAGPTGFYSGDETTAASEMADRYEATRRDGVWSLVRRIPISDGNRLVAHKIDMEVMPHQGIHVVDRLRVAVRSTHGFAIRLNHRAHLQTVRVDAKPAPYHFGGGLLWIGLAQGSQPEVRLEYSINVEKGRDNWNSGRFLEHVGHLRNQYWWHPFFGFGQPNGEAEFEITATLPAAYHLATSLPQTASIQGNKRIVRAKTSQPTDALTIAYDRDWKPQRLSAGKVQLEVFATPDFEPSPDKIAAEFRYTYETFKSRFGAPTGGYFAVVQGRSREGSGWHNKANQAIFAGVHGGSFHRADPSPHAPFHHEIAHAWTAGAAPADHFLTEGWATYAESIILRDKFDSAVERRYWLAQAEAYFANHDGKSFLLRDPNNSGVAYYKGAWIFRMLEQQMGQPQFDKTVALFSKRSLQSPLTSEAFVALFERAQPGLGAFLAPWIIESRAPNLTTRIEGTRITIKQTGPLFQLPLELEVESDTGSTRHTIVLRGKEISVDVGRVAKSVVLDPDHKLLLREQQRTAQVFKPVSQ